MGIEMIGLLIFARLMELSELLRESAGILFFSFVFAVIWLGAIFTIVGRWRGN
jgi:hypothetical protein